MNLTRRVCKKLKKGVKIMIFLNMIFLNMMILSGKKDNTNIKLYNN